MHTNQPKEDPLVELGYEHRDVDYKRLRTSLMYFFGFGVASTLIGALLYTYRFTVFNIPEPKPGINAELARTAMPAGTPALQDNVAAKMDIATLRHAETERMTSTGYLDDSRTLVHIPVDRAMDLIAQRGVSEKNEPADAVSGSHTTPPAGAAPTMTGNAAGAAPTHP